MNAFAIRALALLFVLVGVSSCGIFGKDVVYPCPRVYILADAGNLVRYKPGPGRDITDIVFEGRIANFVGSCDYDEDKGVDIDLVVQIELQRGPAATGAPVSFEYFVALPAFRPKPEGKRIMPVSGTFAPNQTRMAYQDTVHMFIPLAKPEDGYDTEIVIGFQLTPEEIELNRQMRQR